MTQSGNVNTVKSSLWLGICWPYSLRQLSQGPRRVHELWAEGRKLPGLRKAPGSCVTPRGAEREGLGLLTGGRKAMGSLLKGSVLSEEEVQSRRREQTQ